MVVVPMLLSQHSWTQETLSLKEADLSSAGQIHPYLAEVLSVPGMPRKGKHAGYEMLH